MRPLEREVVAAAINARGWIDVRGSRTVFLVVIDELDRADAELLASIIPGARAREVIVAPGVWQVTVRRADARKLAARLQYLLDEEHRAQYRNAIAARRAVSR